MCLLNNGLSFLPTPKCRGGGRLNLKVIGESAVYVNEGLSVNLPEPAGTSEDTR
jgi:hypothetical protein